MSGKEFSWSRKGAFFGTEKKSATHIRNHKVRCIQTLTSDSGAKSAPDPSLAQITHSRKQALSHASPFTTHEQPRRQARVMVLLGKHSFLVQTEELSDCQDVQPTRSSATRRGHHCTSAASATLEKLLAEEVSANIASNTTVEIRTTPLFSEATPTTCHGVSAGPAGRNVQKKLASWRAQACSHPLLGSLDLSNLASPSALCFHPLSWSHRQFGTRKDRALAGLQADAAAPKSAVARRLKRLEPASGDDPMAPSAVGEEPLELLVARGLCRREQTARGNHLRACLSHVLIILRFLLHLFPLLLLLFLLFLCLNGLAQKEGQRGGVGGFMRRDGPTAATFDAAAPRTCASSSFKTLGRVPKRGLFWLRGASCVSFTPLSAPPSQASGAVRCDGGPSPAPWPPST